MNANENMRYIQEYLKSYNNLAISTLRNKEVIITTFLDYFKQKGKTLKELQECDVTNYLLYANKYYNYKNSTMNNIRTQLKLFLNWSFKNNLICFSGFKICKNARIGYRENIITSYNEIEIAKLLDSIDISDKIGKLRNAIMCLFIYYGMRVGDVVNLKFENIDWENKRISIVQQKTKQPLELPLIDNVKYPLLDYIKNGRSDSIDKDYIFIRTVPPYTKYSTSGIYYLIQKVFKDSQINTLDKHHGPHSLRSSLATNLIRNNISLGEICQILGHSTTKTTEQYITKDTTNLKELSLEVLYE